MIVESIMNAYKTFLFTVLGWINIPSFENFDTIQYILTMMFENAESFITFFIPWNVITIGFPILIFIIMFEDIYYLVMWILKKIPMLGIE